MDNTPWRWKNFSKLELGCHHCGEFLMDEPALDALQRLRDALSQPLKVTSGHRCPIWNKAVGGAVKSEHLGLAFDVPFPASGPLRFYQEALKAGFKGIGFGETYLHLDTRPVETRWYYSLKAKQLWESLGVDNLGKINFPTSANKQRSIKSSGPK